MNKEKPTIALCVIVKDEVEAITELLYNDTAINAFDQINLVVSDKPSVNKLVKVFKGFDTVHVKWREWNNRFDDAKNAVQAMVTTKYWFWLDSDDKFDFRAIPKLVEIMEAGEYDQILLPYNYAQDEYGECVALHWRERLFRTSHPFKWKGWVHETPVTDLPYKAHRVNIPVVHNNSDEHTLESLERNHKILLEATAQSDDPRYQLYLGSSYYSLKKYGEAVEVLDKFVQVSGNIEDIYRAFCCMSECANKMKEPNAAMHYAMQAAAQIPEYPQAYRLVAQWEMEQGNWRESLEWCKVAESKPQPNGLGVFDPSAVTQNRLIAVHCHMMLGEFNNALRWLRQISEKHPARQDMEDSLINEADAETFVTLLPKLRKYFESDEALYKSLVYDLKYDVRLRGLRDLVEKPKVWSDNSLVILVGESYEEWGPHTLSKGMGGSEEAVIYLSRELTKLGWDVTVFGAVEEKIEDKLLTHDALVTYLPWREINKNDTFNVFVAWRAPDFTEHIKAKVKIADIHDVLENYRMKNYDDVTYFVKSKWHRSLYPELPDHKFRIIGNGICKSQFA